jgi:membrane-anchored mycosin MYCP
MARSLLRTWLAGGLLAASVVSLGAAPAAADHDAPCLPGEVPESERLADTHTKDNLAFERMHVERAQELATGRGVKVAVIDSGVVDVEGLAVTGRTAIPGVASGFLSGHGTIVAGLIAGPRGVAPDAEVFDVKVYDADDADTTQGERALTSAGIVAGIEAVIDAQPQQQVDIVNISLAVPTADPRLEAAVARLVALDVVVVAAAGNAEPGSDSDAGFNGTPDSDADVFPADYPGVLAVSASPPGDENPSTYVLPNRDTDVAAPTLGAISANANGQVCEVGEIATSWASAEVSGIMALLRQRFPRATPAQLVARLEATTEGAVAGGDADGTLDNPWSGAGVVQARDALTREVTVGRQGRVETTEQEDRADAQAPPAPQRIDLFSTPRAILLWSGLVAGALLALVVMLRPLLRRT